jgi:hypothetical protein
VHVFGRVGAGELDHGADVGRGRCCSLRDGPGSA